MYTTMEFFSPQKQKTKTKRMIDSKKNDKASSLKWSKQKVVDGETCVAIKLNYNHHIVLF